MSCNPQIHPGFQSKFNITINQECDNVVLFPLEVASASITKSTADCIEDNPWCGRLCAIPLSICDSIAWIVVLVLDLIWSLVASIVLSILYLGSCCSDSIPVKDFYVAVVNNLGRLTCNICFGPFVCTMMTSAGCAACNVKTFLTGLVCCPCIYPVTILLNLWSLCVRPKEAAQDMSKQLSEVYNV